MKKPSKALLNHWYAKAAKAGHVEIEDVHSPYESLKAWDSFRFVHLYTPDQIAERQQYFTNCEDVVRTFKFDSDLDRLVWILHAKGYSVRESSRLLNDDFKRKRKKTRISYSKVYSVVVKIKKVLGWPIK